MIDIAYAPLTDATVYTKGEAGTYPTVAIQNSSRVVESVTVDDGAASERVTNYQYSGGKVNVSRSASLGFERITVTDTRTELQEVTTYRQDFP